MKVLRARIPAGVNTNGSSECLEVFRKRMRNVAPKSTHLPPGMPAVSPRRVSVPTGPREQTGTSDPPKWASAGCVHRIWLFRRVLPPSFFPPYSPEVRENRENNDQYLRSTPISMSRRIYTTRRSKWLFTSLSARSIRLISSSRAAPGPTPPPIARDREKRNNEKESTAERCVTNESRVNDQGTRPGSV